MPVDAGTPAPFPGATHPDLREWDGSRRDSFAGATREGSEGPMCDRSIDATIPPMQESPAR